MTTSSAPDQSGAPRDIYLDHAATTAVHPDVLAAMLPYFTTGAGNPSSVHHRGQAARQGLESARRAVARALGCRSREVVFTGGGSEADNLAIKGVAHAHHAVGHSLDRLEREGFAVTYVPVDQHGLARVEDIERAIRPDTCLITVMYANNEVGTIQPIAEIGALAHRHGILFHTDAVQAGGSLPINV